MRKKASLKDIAHKANVSIALVSYVLNGKNMERINSETAIRIKEIAEDFNYRPNQIAKSLKSNKTYTIGLIVADISNFFYSYIAGFIESEANVLGYSVLYGSAYEDPIRFRKLLQIMIDRQVDGLILAIPEGADNCFDDILRSGIPYVLIDREFPEYPYLKTVCLDNFHASSLVAEKFNSLNCKSVAGITLDSNLHHLEERKRGFIESSKSIFNKKNVQIYTVSEDDISLSTVKVVEKILANKSIDGLCCFTNKIAMAVLPQLLNKVKVPQDLKIICFDEVEAFKLFPYPISVVKQPLSDMSKKAVSLLFDQDNVGDLTHYFKAEIIDINT